MPIAPPNSAPYDSLETVTQLTRTVLGDYIAGIDPAPQGLCNVGGHTVTRVSGPSFSIYFNGAQITVNGQPNTVKQVTNANNLLLVDNAAVAALGVPWVATIPTGDIFADSQAYVVPTINLAWRKLQKKLADKGHPKLEAEADIFNLPVCTNRDPISQQYITWTGFFDGTAFQQAPALPQCFISPLRLWERPSTYPATPNLNMLRPMRPAADGLFSSAKGSWNCFWDWREDAIYFRGAIVPLDLRVRFAAYLPDLVPAVGGFAQTPVPIMRSAEALAYYTAAEFVNPRGGVMGGTWEAKGDMAVDQITNANAKMQQRASYSRIPWGGRRRRSGLQF